MHIPAHVLDPMTCAAAGAISTAAVSYAAYRVKEERVKQGPMGGKLPLMTLAGAAILAAQAFNFPIATGSSGHFLGGAAAGILLGPWAGMLVMAAVVVVQCFLFHDGGVDALGANILNMAVVGCLVGRGIDVLTKQCVAGRPGVVLGAGLAAWCSVLASASACSIEVSLGGGYPIAPLLAEMLSVHSLIAVGEVLITGFAVALALESAPRCTWRTAAVGVVGAVALAVAMMPFVSGLPDGLETCLSLASAWSRS